MERVMRPFGAQQPEALAARFQDVNSILKTNWDIFELVKAFILGGLVLLLVL